MDQLFFLIFSSSLSWARFVSSTFPQYLSNFLQRNTLQYHAMNALLMVWLSTSKSIMVSSSSLFGDSVLIVTSLSREWFPYSFLSIQRAYKHFKVIKSILLLAWSLLLSSKAAIRACKRFTMFVASLPFTCSSADMPAILLSLKVHIHFKMRKVFLGLSTILSHFFHNVLLLLVRWVPYATADKIMVLHSCSNLLFVKLQTCKLVAVKVGISPISLSVLAYFSCLSMSYYVTVIHSYM